MSWIYAIVFSPFTFMAAFLNGRSGHHMADLDADVAPAA